MKKIIKIDEEKCEGCGLCADACHQGAIAMVDGKARLVGRDVCDGLGNCLPVCPAGAIELVEQERERPQAGAAPCCHAEASTERRYQWPLQIKLVPVDAPYFRQADLLIAADCTAYAAKDFNGDIRKNRAVVIGCPKLDSVDYTEKLAEIIRRNDVKSVTVARMEVPCCGGIEHAARQALAQSGSSAPLDVVTLSADGSFVSP